MDLAVPHLPQDDTDRLVRQAASGDPSAVAALLERHRQHLRRMVAVRLDARIAARVDPSDVVQETLITAHKRLDAYLADPVVPFYIWLRQLAWDRLADLHRLHVRAARRSVTREYRWTAAGLSDESTCSLFGCLPSAQSTPSEKLMRQEFLRRARQAMELLRETDREILVMRHLEELSVTEVANILGIAPGTVKSRHFRALERLQSVLNADRDDRPEEDSCEARGDDPDDG
jgi:RNA polymerase sigma-70 factor (ECF subfamily)